MRELRTPKFARIFAYDNCLCIYAISCAVADRPRDACACQFNSVIPRRSLLLLLLRLQMTDLPLRTIKCCSVVFGVTFRLLVTNTSSSSPVKKRRRLPATSVNNLPRSVAAACIALCGRTVHSTRWSQILAENSNFGLPGCILRSRSGGGRSVPVGILS